MEDTQTQEKTGFQHLFMQLNRAYAAKCFSQMTALGIHPGQIPILLLLAKRVEMSQREIAEELCVKPPTVNVMVQRMEKAGLIGRRHDEKDQRITRIQLAPKGEECIDGIRCVLTEMEEIIYQGISREEVLLMKRLLTEMKNNLLESKDFKGVDMQTIMEKTHPSMKHM